MTVEPHDKLIARHVRTHVGPIAHVFRPPGPALVPVDVLHCPPTLRRPWHTLVTCGMSRRPMCPPEEARDCRWAELFLCLPSRWRLRLPDHGLERMWPVQELADLARLPHISESWVW